MSEESTTSADELLRLFLNAPSEERSAKFLDLLMENYALPTIKKVLWTKFGGLQNDSRFFQQNYEDLLGESCLKIVGVLRQRKITTDIAPIRDFPAYCAVIGYNVWNSFVREQSPERESLKNRILYSLDKDGRFVKETDAGGEKFYYLQTHKSSVSLISIDEIIALIKKGFDAYAQAALPDLLAAIFDKADGGLTFEELLKIVADLWQVRDFPNLSLDDFTEDFPSSDFQKDAFEMRYKLEYIWQEIRALPVLQRTALLYNLRDERGGEMLLSFFNTRLAALVELAAAMNLTKAEFIKLLPHLPFDDKKIAGAMNLSVKQIGNLRKSARDSLRRRLEGKAKRKSKSEKAENYIFIVDDNDALMAKSEFIN